MGERKISNADAAPMIAVAILLDLLNIVVDFVTVGLGGFFVDFCTGVIFAIWFSHYGVSLGSSRNAGRTMLAVLLDAFPITDLTFPWTWQVAYTALTERHPTSQEKKTPSRSPWRL